MRQTLLEIVQSCLARTDGDEINDINDTTESIQAVTLIKDTFSEFISRKKWPHTKKFLTLENSGDTSKPTHIRVPDNVYEVIQDSIRYDKRKATDTRSKYAKVRWLEPDDFLRITNGRDTSASNTLEVTDYDGAKLVVFTDRAPEFYTTFDDEYIVCDSYDSGVDSTVNNSKFQLRGYVVPAWESDNDFYPDLPIDAYPTFVAECMSVCSTIFRQEVDGKAEQAAQRGNRRLSRKAWKTRQGIQRPNFGRNSYKSRLGNPPFNDN